MSDRSESKPRTLRELLDECLARAHGRPLPSEEPKPLPLPPPDAPTPPRHHQERDP